MNNLVQTTASLAFDHSRFDHYEVLLLDQSVEMENLGDDSRGTHNWGRSTPSSKSKKKKEAEQVTNCISYRRERARKRHVFLQTYKLSSPKHVSSGGSCAITSKKLKKLMVKAKSVVVSIINFVHISSSRTSCKGHQSIYVSSGRSLGEIFCC